jgi:hypothetical protein
VVADGYGRLARAGGAFSVLSFHAEQEQSLIVYGTGDEAPTNREAAQALQKAVREGWSNRTIPVKSDREVSEGELRTHHLLLVGWPDSNSLVARFRSALPVTFGSRSFVVRGKTYAHPGSAVIAAATNPLNQRFSVVVIAGLGAESTLGAPPVLLRRGQRPGEVLLLPHRDRPLALVVPAREAVAQAGPR